MILADQQKLYDIGNRKSEYLVEIKQANTHYQDFVDILKVENDDGSESFVYRYLQSDPTVLYQLSAIDNTQVIVYSPVANWSLLNPTGV